MTCQLCLKDRPDYRMTPVKGKLACQGCVVLAFTRYVVATLLTPRLIIAPKD